jgi:RHS repeat-associated protein
LPLNTRTNNSARMPISENDSRNRNSQFTRNTITTAITASLHPDATTDTTTRNTFNQPLVSTDRLGRITTRTYSTLGDLLTEKTATGTADESTRTFLYNTRGQVIEMRDALYDANFPELHNTRYEYNTNGFLVKKIDAADVAAGTRPETVFTYDTPGRLATTTDPLGRTVTYGYDVQNRHVSTTYADTSTELVQYGTALEANLVKKTTDRNGYETTYQYDAAARVTTTVTASNTSQPFTETCTYLTGTNLKQTCTLNGSKTEYLFDHRNRVIGTKVFPDTTTTLTRSTELDELGRTRSTTDAYGRKTFYLYDHNDRVTRTVTETVPGALAAPAFVVGSSQTAANQNYTLTTLNSTTLQTNPNNDKRTHLVTYTDPRDTFLKNLTRDLNPNAPYLIEDAIHDAEGQTLITTDARGIHTWREYDKQGRNTLTIMAVGTADEIRSQNSYDDNSNLLETKNPRHFKENIASIDQYAYTGRNLKKSHTTVPGTTLEATQSWTYYLDGTSNEHKDFRNNTAKQIWRVCCARLQATIDRDGTSTTIQNTDFKGQVIHTATVTQNPNGNWTNPVDLHTLQEITTRYDGRGRPTHSTVWLVALGDIGSCCGGSGGEAPIAGLGTSPAANGLTTAYAYDDDLTDNIGLDDTYEAQLDELTNRGTTFGAIATGSAVEITNPAGEKTVQIRDAIGRTVMTINPEGHITTMHYDEVQPVAGVTPASPAGIPIPGDLLITASADALGHTTTSYADGAGRTLLTADARGNLAGAAYDANSNRVISRDPNGLGENCTFDNLNRDITCTDLQEQAETTNRSKTYNAHNAVVTATNAEGHTIENTYDVRDRLAFSEDANNIITSYGYDKNNNLRTLTDGEGNTRAWFFDARNLNIARQSSGATPPTSGSTFVAEATAPAASASPDVVTYQYDVLSRLTVKTAQDSSTITHTFDFAGRMTEREYSDSTTDTFEYDAASRLTQSTKGRYSVTTEHEYFPDSAPETETFTFDGRTYALSRTYDDANRPVTHTFGDGKVQTWFYDDRNLVTSSTYDTKNIFTQEHDAGYRLTEQTFGNGLTRTITYNRLDNCRSTDTVLDNNTVIGALTMSYSYSIDKQVTGETFPNGSVLASTSFAAQYDPGNRVTDYNRSGGVTPPNQTWSYDDNGNWSSTTLAGQTDTRTHNSDNELTSGNCTYDARGNMTKDPDGNEYHYDLDNRIWKIEMHQGTTVEFLYDATGRRVQSKQGSTKTAYLWWGDQECSEHKHQAGQSVIQNDLWAHPTALNTIIARAVDGSKFKMEWYHKNYLDHVMAVSDDSGDLLEHYRYSAFGIVEFYDPAGNSLAGSQINNPVLWNSRRYDESTKLHYYKYRHYSPKLGRWHSRDPIEEEGGMNLYGFVGNNGIGYFDKLGLSETTYNPNIPGSFGASRQNCCEGTYEAKVVALADFKYSNETKTDRRDAWEIGTRFWSDFHLVPDNVLSTNDMVTKIEALVETLKKSHSQYCFVCIKELIISGHGTTGNLVQLSSDKTTEGTFGFGKNSLTEELANRLKTLLCKESAVRVNSCTSASDSDQIKQLQSISDKLGVPVAGEVGDALAGVVDNKASETVWVQPSKK